MKNWLIIFSFIFFCSSIIAQKEIKFSTYFKTNKANLRLSDFSRLTRYIDSISKLKNVGKIKVFGYCDDVGEEANNLMLSQKRSEFVSEQIKIKANKQTVLFSPVGKGELPINDESNFSISEQRTKNRRVDIIVYFNDKNQIIDDYHEKGDRIILDNVLFQGGKTVFLPRTDFVLHKLVDELKEKKKLHIQLQGHINQLKPQQMADSTLYRPEDNLSTRRAKKVYDFLISNGIDKERLSYVGFEGKFPLGTYPQYNRRVEIEITDIKE
ncbi:OmpA family protein [Aquimarina sp. MMG015]|uniref:OmpA family protein n=1 Tax=Aquimarina sp. MMG015 TaxID=2822689 RepID=UPI001B39E596|nr:OmpA family protein [Aquimarina sp. MMG015]MBQ4802234.1 OmpA family protein [Aquimarina sp. MMG015]